MEQECAVKPTNIYMSKTKDIIYNAWSLQIFNLFSLENPEDASLYVYTVSSSSLGL